MFDSLKKKLKAAIEKVSKSVKEEEVKEEIKEPVIGEKPELKEEIQERKEEIRDYIEEIKKEEIPKIKEEKREEIKPGIKAEEKYEEEIKELTKIEEEIIEEPKEKKEEKRGLFSRIFKKEKPAERAPEKIIHEELKPEVKIKEKEEKKEEIEEPKEEKRGFFGKVVKKVVEKKLTEEEIEKILKELKIVLMENDVAFETVEKISSDLKNDLIGQEVKRGSVETTITDSLRKSILNCMKQPRIEMEKMIEEKYEKTKEPLLIVFCGFNGTGKTTTIAKLAHRLKKYNPILAAGDTFRAASIEQLEEHGRRVGVKVVKHKYGSDSAAVIFDAVKHAKSIGSKVVLADTAGRSHSNVNLMDELKKVIRVNKPDMKILVLDSITGNDIYDQAKLFNYAVQVDGIIMTKADVYEKGAALSASHTIKKPILYLGVGQNYDDLKEFNPEEIVNNLLG